MNTIILGAHDQAPDFTGTAVGAEFGDGMPMRLSDYFDSQIVLYFYPQDHTPGCTAQACKLRDAWEEFGGRAALFGVSADSPETHRQFIDVHSLPFPLISDSDQRIVRAYGVWLDAAEGGTVAKYHTERTTFIIAPGGTIKSVLRKVDPYQHDRLLLEMLYS